MLLGPKFSEAIVYAAELHAAQTRKGSDIPYLSHLMAVASMVLEHGADEEVAIAALLHDGIEDQGGAATRRVIQEKFGPRVAELVDAATDADTLPKPPWRERKETFIARLADLSPDAKLIIAADKLHNVRTLLSDYRLHGEDLWSRFTGQRDGTLWYYRAAADALAKNSTSAITEELSRAVSDLENLANGKQK